MTMWLVILFVDEGSGTISEYVVATETAAIRNEEAKLGEDVILCDATANSITVNLPTAVGNHARFHIKKTDSSVNTVTINGDGTETIDGGLTAVLRRQYESVTLIADGANWLII
jgi:hypothetical protein